MSDISDNGS